MFFKQKKPGESGDVLHISLVLLPPIFSDSTHVELWHSTRHSCVDEGKRHRASLFPAGYSSGPMGPLHRGPCMQATLENSCTSGWRVAPSFPSSGILRDRLLLTERWYYCPCDPFLNSIGPVSSLGPVSSVPCFFSLICTNNCSFSNFP